MKCPPNTWPSGSGSELVTPPGRAPRGRETGEGTLAFGCSAAKGKEKKGRKERVRGLMGDINFWAIILQEGEGEGEGGQEK